MKNRRVVTALFLLFFFAILFLLWEWVIVHFSIPKRLLPRPSEIFVYLKKEFFGSHYSGYETILGKSLYSLTDAILGFCLASVLGTMLGILSSGRKTLRALVGPSFFLSQLIPLPAFAPIVASIFGYDWQTKIIIIVLFTVFPIMTSVEKAVDAIPLTYKNLLKTYNADLPSRFFKLTFPAILPSLFTVLKIVATASFVASIIAEISLTVSQGIGKDLFTSFNNQVMVRVWASLLVIGLTGLAFFETISFIERKVLRHFKYEGFR